MKKGLKLKIFLAKSKIRKLVWDRLNEPKTATEVAKDISKHRSSVSRVLLDMENEGLARCINPDDKSFRHYVKI